MVFESIVVDILNRLLGDYFENLDTSQLKLGIWGGDVVLRELLLKNSSMDDLGLPFKVVVGKVGTLRMKIPWKSLYTAPVELNLQNLLLLVTPSYAVKYDEEAEEKALQAAKQKEIARLDEIRARERLRKQEGGDTPQHEDSFTEKLTTQIIKNVQIRIDCIHIRYEDDVTKPESPFGFGVILKSFHIETTDEDWKPAIISENVETVNKMATLEGLALYWNSKTQLIQKGEKKADMIEALKDLVLNDNNLLTYILGPIASVAKVNLTPNPERSAQPFSKPKFWVDVVMEQLGLGMTNLQFQDIMELVESLDLMTRAQSFRKYRPNTTLHKGHYKEWWKFMYKCIVEEEVRRKRQNWDWLHMKRHRGLCRTYADAYYKKLTLKKLKTETTQALHHCEKELDVFNITLVRKQVEFRIEREGKHREQTAQQGGGGGWFSGWTSWMGGEGSDAAKPTESTIGDIAQKFELALTPEEKAKLYDAIDYSENALPLDYPETYEEYFLRFRLNTLSFIVKDAIARESKKRKILDVKISLVEVNMITRPVKNGLKVDVFMDSLEAEGLQGKHETAPVKMITSKTLPGQTHLFIVNFESNPLHSQANQKIKVQAQPIEVLYHGKTVVQLAKCFTLPSEMKLNKLQAAAMSTINDWREQSAAGLQHLIETRGEIDVDIDLVAPYFLIPRDGKLDPRTSVLVIDLGELKVKSVPRNKQTAAQEKILNMGKISEKNPDYIDTMKKVAYDTLIIELRDFQIFIALPGEDYKAAVSKDNTTEGVSITQTLLKSSKLLLRLDQSLIPDDPRFARLQLEGSLPMLDLDLSEYRLMELVKLLVTLPFPQADVPTSSDTPSKTLNTISEDPTVAQSFAITQITYGDTAKPKPLAEFIELIIKFTIDAIRLRVSRTNDERVQVPFVDFELKHIQAKLTNKTFSNAVEVAVGGLTLCALQNKIPNSDGPLYLLKTPMTLGIEKHLFKMHMFSILPDCPIKLAGTVKQLIQLDVTSIDVILHHEALQSFIAFGDEIQQALEIASAAGNSLAHSDSVSISSQTSISSSFKGGGRRISKQFSRMEANRRAVAKKHKDVKDVLLQIDAKMESFTVQMSSEKKNLIRAVLQEMNFSMMQTVGKTVMLMDLVDLGVRNLDPNTIYKDMISVDSDKVVSIKVVMYEDATKGKMYSDMDKHDMSVKIETGSPKIYYISRQLDELLAFIDNFATAKEAVIDASAAAAQAAKENVEQAYAAASRILLDINLNAPIVFIPRNEKSNQGLLADLGRLSLKNKFTKLQVPHLSTYAIVDKLDIHLTNMKVSRIVFDKNSQNLQSEVLMIDPVNFKLNINRNLSSDWYHGIPNMALNGTLWSALVRASNEDYDIVMATLFENILYTPDTPPPVSPSITASKANQLKKKREENPVASKAVSGSSFHTVLSSRSSVDPSLYTEMEVNLEIPLMRVIMYQKGAIKLEESQGMVVRNEATAFADFTIKSVQMHMKSSSNGNMVCPITIEEINLKDVRPGTRAVTNLIQRKFDYDETEPYAAKFSYTTDVANKKGSIMKLETTSLTIVLCLDYLLQILEFFSRSEVPETTAPKPDLSTKYEKYVTRDDPVPVREVTADSPQVTVGLEVQPEADPFSAFYSFAETEIILVESMDTVQSNALLLHCEVSMKQQEIGGRSNMMGTIGNLILSTCKYDSDEKHEAVAEVISPMSITVVMNYSEAVGTLIDVNISDIFIRMTAGTLELLLKIMSTIGGQGDVAAEGKVVVDYCNLWDVKRNDEMNFWFLNPDASVEVGLEALQVQEDTARLFNVAEDLKVSERLVLESGCVVFTFETGVGNNTMPMLLIETDIDLQMFDWSTNMTAAGRMKLEAAYYNATYGLWEFLVEPVETRHHGRVAHQPWEILFEYSSRVKPGLSAGEEEGAPTSYMSIALESSSILELTVTRTALDVIDVLKDDFQAATKKLISEKAISTAAYTIVNDTGSDVRIFIKEKNRSPSFILMRNGIEYEEVVLKTGTSVNLSLIESSDMTKHHSSVLREQEGKEERLLSIQIEDYEFKKEIPVNRASKRFYSLKKPGQHGSCGMICDTWVKDCSKIVTLRGVVQIMNDLQLDVDIYYKEHNGKNAKLAGTALVGQKFNLPIPCTYTKSGELFFAPEGYHISTEPFSWTTALQELEKISQLKSKSSVNKDIFFYMNVMGEAKQALHESTNRKSLASQCCYIYLEPPLLINNLLPVSLGYRYHPNDDLVIAERGTSICVTNAPVELDGYCKLMFKVPDYNSMSWVCDVVIDKTTPEISQWTFKCETNPKMFGTLGLHREVDDNEVTWHIYMPYWMINRTGLDLLYRGDDKHSHQTPHPKEYEEPVLFSFPGKAFFAKKACCVKVKHHKLPSVGTDWSEKFSMDVAGSGGSVICKSPIQNFQLGVEIQLSSWGLTKYIIFTPRFYMVNQCSFEVLVKEQERPDNIIDLKPDTCIPFWPESDVPHLIAIIETENKKNETKTFKYDCVRHTLLQLKNKYGGIHVDIHFSEAKTVITFSEFIPGQAPVLLVNATTDCPFEISEEGLEDVFILLPRMCQLFTWKEPIGERILHWSAIGAEKKPQGSDKLFGDGFGLFVASTGNAEKEYFWISFLDGLQRVLLFTPDVELATYLQAARDNEVATAEYIVMLQGIGLSLVDNENLKEIMYMRIASSEITWESCKPSKKKRFKPLPVGVSRSIEMAYQNYLNQKAIFSGVKSTINLDNGMELEFATMKINKPHEKHIRRVFQTGIWIHYKTLPNSTQFHAKINRLQIDNQMPDNVFRVVFAPVPPPKSVLIVDYPKPFAEVSIMQRINAHNYVQQYKYFKILVQEFHLKLDINFVNAIIDMFSGSSTSKQENMLAKFTTEYEEAHLSTKEVLARQIVSQGQKHFYDFLHFSPLKIHISFSMGGSAQLSNHFLNLVLASVGVTLTEIQDVVFKLSCMELQHSFISGEQLYNEVYNHYSSQAIKQLYVLVLGLDVLGNPYGLAMGVASGVEAFFYEPIQGAIQGPGEFAEGLALGVKSLLGSTVGGAAGAFSKITGTLGKGIAALTMDDEYQKKRRENMHHRGDAAEGLARSGKGLIMGFVDGISGLVTKPVRGYKEDGVGGFFKGMGKGAIGFIARPAAGVVDFASGSFDAVKKCSQITVDVHRMRPPRCIPGDSVLQPYVKHEAEGVQLMNEVEKGRYAKTDTYIAHALINPHGIYVILLTNKRLFYLKRDELFGGWTIEWSYIWEEFACPPDLVERGLLFRLKAPPHKRFKYLRSTGSTEILVPIYSAEVCTWLLSKIEEAMKSETGIVFTDGMEATEYSFA